MSAAGKVRPSARASRAAPATRPTSPRAGARGRSPRLAARADLLPLRRDEDAHRTRVASSARIDARRRRSRSWASTTAVAPSTRNGSRPLMPPMWNSGRPESQTSSAPAPHLVDPAQRARDEVAVASAPRPSGGRSCPTCTHERSVVLGQLRRAPARGGERALVRAPVAGARRPAGSAALARADESRREDVRDLVGGEAEVDRHRDRAEAVASRATSRRTRGRCGAAARRGRRGRTPPPASTAASRAARSWSSACVRCSPPKTSAARRDARGGRGRSPRAGPAAGSAK